MAVKPKTNSPSEKEAPSGMRSLIRKTNEEEYHRLLFVYGEQGAGKTHLLGTAIDAKKKILVLDGDLEGRETLEDLPIDAVGMDSMDTFEEFMDFLIREGYKDYDVIAIDTLSSLQITIMEDLESTGQGQDVWRRADIARNLVVGKLRELRKRPVMLIVTAHEQRKFRKASGTSDPILDQVLPKLFPSVWEGVNTITSAVGRLTKGESDEVKSILDFRRRPVFMAKDRTGKLPRTLENPTIGAVLEAFNG